MSHPRKQADGLVLSLPRDAGEALSWWRFEDGALVESGLDIDPLSASLFDMTEPARKIFALLPASISRADWAALQEELPLQQAEALAARSLAENAIGGLDKVHAVARAHRPVGGAGADGDADAVPAILLAVLVGKAELAGGLALLADRGIDPSHVVPSYCVARQAADLAGEDCAIVAVGGEAIFVGEGLLMPAEPTLEEMLAPGRQAVEVAPSAVEQALAAILADPPIDMLAGPFARRQPFVRLHAQQWKVLGWLLVAILVVTLLIGLVTWWRYGQAAEGADARSLAAIEAVIGEQPDLGAAETALDQRLARTGRGGAAFSVPLSALYQALQPTPQVSVRQLGYTADGTLAVSLAAPDAAPVNQVLTALQAAGYRVTAQSRVDDTGSSIFDLTVRGY